MAWFLLSFLIMDIKGQMEHSLIDVYTSTVDCYSNKSKIGRLFYTALFTSLLIPTNISADTNKIFVSDLNPQKQNTQFLNNDVSSDEISCGVNFKGSYFEDDIEVSTNNREALLSSVDERMIQSCKIDTSEVQRRLISKSVVLVDTRSEDEFESYRIQGSLNLSPFEIKSKEFLKSKHLVLVSDNSNLIEMGLLCHELKKHGYKKVSFMNGGIAAWGEKLIGRDAHTIDRWALGKITPKKFASIKSKIDWLVLDVSMDLNKSNSQYVFDGLKVISFDMENEQNLDELKKHLTTVSNKNMYGILVVSMNGESYSDVDKVLTKNNIKNIYYLEDGMSSYAKYMAERKVFLARLKRGPVKSRSCSSI